MAWNQTDRSFKTLINRRTTSVAKNFYEEFGDNTINITMSEIWIDPISSTPSLGISQGIVQQYTLFTLTEDITVPSQQAYFADSGLPSDDLTNPTKPMPLKNWISPKFGYLYEIKLYDNSNNQIFPTDASQWFFDYQTGYLTFNSSTGSFTKPFKITGYRYTGNVGKVVKDLAFSGTAGLGVHYTDGSVNFLPITATGGGITGPVSGLKNESVLMTLQAGVPQVIDYSQMAFEQVVNVQFFEVTSYGTNGTAGGEDDTITLGLLNVSINQLTQTIIVNPDIDVQGILQIVGTGDLTLIGNVTNATTINRGVVQIATSSDLQNGNDIGSSGAILSVPPSIIKNAIQSVNYLILPPPNGPFDNVGTVGYWSYDNQFIYYCLPCYSTSGTCGNGGKIWRRSTIEIW